MSPTGERVIVVAGEALIDLVPDATGRLGPHPGGGPFNTARTIARLEQAVCFLGRISTDAFGRRLLSSLEADGVRLDAVVPTDDPSTLALAELDAAGAARYLFYVDGTSAPGLTLAAAERVLEDPAALYVGALGLSLEPIATTLEAVLVAIGDRTFVVLDPNCRPSTIADPAAYRARLARMLRRCDVLKASEEDLDWLHPGSTSVDAARRLLAHGTPVALITRGGDGALVVTHDRVIEIPPVPVRVVDTIGAGDAFGGAFLTRWVQQGLERDDLVQIDKVAEAAGFACLVAARTCERAGAVPPRLRELV